MTRIQDVDLDVVEAQIDAVLMDISADIVKIGMLASPEIVRTVAKALRRHGVKRIVLDPVLRATSGASLGGDDTAQAMIAELFPIASLITPNLEEASLLLGREISGPNDFKLAAQELLDMGPQAVLIKGGHLDATHTQITDFLMWRSVEDEFCLLYTSPSPRDRTRSRMPSSA